MKTILLFLFAFNSYGQSDLSIAIGNAQSETRGIQIRQSTCKTTSITDTSFMKKSLEKVKKIILNDFLFYKEEYQISEVSKGNEFSKESSFMIDLSCSPSKRRTLNINFDNKVTSIRTKLEYEVGEGISRTRVHEISDKIYNLITNKKSIFLSKIVFVSDENTKLGKVDKELFLMDFDGLNVRKLTNHKGVVLSPAFSPDNNKIIYSLIAGGRKKNIALYELNLKTKKIRTVSNRKGINSGAVYTKDGKGIYLTLSHGSNSEIYHLELNTNRLRKITSHYSVDVDPSVTSDGGLMTFLSGRAGKAMIYTLDPSSTEKNVKRISYVGKFNASPRFSPDGSEIVFASWLDNAFDLFRLSSTGHSLVRLTKNFGSNEEPSYSPDGQFIVFASKRSISRVKADQNLYIMTRDGKILGQLTKNIGQCTSPRFSN